MTTQRGGSDFAPPEIPRPLDEVEKQRALAVLRKHAQGEKELQTFVQMLGLVDEELRDVG